MKLFLLRVMSLPTKPHHCLKGLLESLKKKKSGGWKVGSVSDEPTRTGFTGGLIDLGTETWIRDAQMVCVWQAEGGAG